MRRLAWAIPVAVASLALAGCSDTGDDSGRSPTGPVSPAGDASSEVETNPLIDKAVAEYRTYVLDQSAELVRVVKVFTDAVRANNLQAAQAAFAPSREPWERIEPIAGLVEDIDSLIDARVDDFAGVDDPKFTGWHKLEYLLFDKNTTEGGAALADRLDEGVARLQQQLPNVVIAPVNVASGAAELIEEVSEGKITGEEDRYSKTDLWDFDANLQGSRAAIERLKPALQQANSELLSKIEKGFADIDATLAPLRRGDGWVLFCPAGSEFPTPRCPEVTVPPQTVDSLKAQLAGLSENLSQVAGALGLT